VSATISKLFRTVGIEKPRGKLVSLRGKLVGGKLVSLN
jgi:hypothetical protein